MDMAFGKFLKKILDLFRPTVNFGAKQKVEFQIFVLKGYSRSLALFIVYRLYRK